MYKRQSLDPRQIKAQFESKCAESGKTINKGDLCIYYPLTKNVFHIDSEQARKYREYQWDLENGNNY